MTDIMGHLAFGALFALPAWFIWKQRVSMAFITLVLLTSLLPDIDLWLSRWFPAQIHHHGVTHTVLFVVVASLIIGGVAAFVLTPPLDEWLGWERFDRSSMFVFSSVAFLLGGFSHIFADTLSAPDISTPIEPFWPFFNSPISVDVIYYNDPMWNSVFLFAMVLVHAGIAYVVTPRHHRYRFREQAA